KSKKAESAGSRDKSPAWAGTTDTRVAPRVVAPLRANDVHDSRVRRIATITPDMVCPKPHDFAPGASAHDPPKAERFGDRIMRPLIFRARSDAKPVPNFADRALSANRVTISPTGLGR